jgi:ribosome maturation factor RimP
MSDRDNSKNLKETLRKIVESSGLECYWIEVSASRPAQAKSLRIYIDKDGGAGHADCETVSRLVNDYLDLPGGRPWFEGKYFVEVSSPGIERGLFTQEHYRKSLGERTLVSTKNRKKYEGTLISCDSDGVTIEADDGTRQAVAFLDIKRGNLVYVSKKGEKKGGHGRQKKDKPQGKNS